MTRKQALIEELNTLKAAVGEQPVSAAWCKRAKTWTVEALIELYKK